MPDKKSPLKNLKEEAGTAIDKAAAKAQKADGAVKEALGKATGNKKLQVEGKIQKTAGKAKDIAAGLKDKARDAVEKAKK